MNIQPRPRGRGFHWAAGHQHDHRRQTVQFVAAGHAGAVGSWRMFRREAAPCAGAAVGAPMEDRSEMSVRCVRLRFLSVALACAALGIVTAVAVVVLLAFRLSNVRVHFVSASRCEREPVSGSLCIFMVFGNKGCAYQSYVFPRPTMDEHGTFLPHDWDTPLEQILPPQAAAYGRDFWASGWRMFGLTRFVEFYGWPWRAAYCVSDLSFTSGGMGVATTGVAVSRWSHRHPGFGVPFAVVIPTQPLWPGLAGDAGVFAGGYAVTPVVLWCLRRVRRSRRAARGSCPRCDYDLSGVRDGACPECGARLPERCLGPAAATPAGSNESAGG